MKLLVILIALIMLCLILMVVAVVIDSSTLGQYATMGLLISFVGFVVIGVTIGICTPNYEPTALDVYRGKTTLEITYRDSVAIELLCSQEQFHNEQIFEMKRQQVFENQIWQMLGSLNIVPFKDGNKWCCLYGKDLMSGIAGFGDTPYLAAVNLYEELNKI